MGYIYVENEPQEQELNQPKVRLVGIDGNAFSIMGAVHKAMKAYQRVDPGYNTPLMFEEYQKAAMSGDYDHLLQITMNFCEVY